MLDFRIEQDQAELLAELLWQLGVVAIEELPVDEDWVVLRTSMGEDFTDVQELIQQSFPSVLVSIAYVEKSVADTWRHHAVPTWVTEEVVLCPAWLPAPSVQHCIFIEPADTFGLGNHPTTVLALRLGLRHCDRHSKVFDFGCGSGVLGIAAAKILQCESFMFDIAHNAEQVVRMNDTANHTHTFWQSDIRNILVDFVFANILAPVLKSESKIIQDATGESGRIVLSGMRDEQVADVLLSYQLCHEIERESLDGWTAVVLQKN